MSKAGNIAWRIRAKANRLCTRCGKPLGEETTLNHRACTRATQQKYNKKIKDLSKIIVLQAKVIEQQKLTIAELRRTK
jgi:hypothetical protein